MRVRVIFNLENKGGLVPFHHQHLISQLLESAFSSVSFSKDFQHQFTFSGLKGETKVGKSGLHFFSDRVTLVLGSQKKEVIEALLEFLFGAERVKIGELNLLPIKSVYEQEQVFELPKGSDAPSDGNYIKSKYVCISPLVVRNPLIHEDAKQFISPDNDFFSDLLYESTMLRMEKSKQFSIEQINSFFKFQVVPDKDYLRRIKSEEKKFARIYAIVLQGQPVEIRGYTLPFYLFAAPEVHEFIFYNGLGELCNNGYGMLDLTTHNFAKRTAPNPPEKEDLQQPKSKISARQNPNDIDI